MASTLKGIDVSVWNGTIDWEKVKAAGIQFAILRAGYGAYTSQKDKQFEANYKNARAAGVPIGVYWYTYATTESRAKLEATACLECLEGKTLELPVFYDMEYESSILALATSTRTAVCKAFLEAIKAGGFTPGLYSSTDFATNRLTMSKLSGYPLWIAQYASKCTYSGSYDIWQYSSSGAVSGISGNTDMNYMYSDLLSSGTTSSTSTSTSSSSDQLTVDGKIGPATVKRGQTVFGTTVDGKISGQNSKHKTYWTSISSSVCDWSGGTSQFVKALQKKVGVTQDGSLGPDTAKATQKWLIGMGYSCGSKGADGYFGTESAKAFQQWLNAQ